jgi:hypothetical protein
MHYRRRCREVVVETASTRDDGLATFDEQAGLRAVRVHTVIARAPAVGR